MIKIFAKLGQPMKKNVEEKLILFSIEKKQAPTLIFFAKSLVLKQEFFSLL
jgi:hypothetical protein